MLILSLGALYFVVPVYAQIVTVSNLHYSSTSVLGKQATVSFTVNYGGASAGDYLIISVWDVNANNYASGSTINSYPDSCPQITGTYSWAAGCAYALSNLQAAPDYATETVSFALAMNSVGTYQFSPLAAIEDTSFNVLASSPTTQNEFSISVLDKFTLTVSLPSQVPLTLDGVQQGAGSTNLQLSPRAHEMSVPDIVQLDSTSRLKFNGWSDGSNQTMRTFDLESDTEIVATYVTQYFVTSTTDSTLQSGWYDQGTVLQFTVDNRPLVNKYRLFVGGFDGWYNMGQLRANSPTTSLTIDGPINLSDRWNYLPYFPPVLIVVIVAAILLLARRGTYSCPPLT